MTIEPGTAVTRYEVDESVATITLNRQHHNAWTPAVSRKGHACVVKADHRVAGPTTNPTTVGSGHATDRRSNFCQCGSGLGLKSRKFCSTTS